MPEGGSTGTGGPLLQVTGTGGPLLQVPGQKQGALREDKNGIEMSSKVSKQKKLQDKTPRLGKDNKVSPADAPEVEVEVGASNRRATKSSIACSCSRFPSRISPEKEMLLRRQP